MRSSMSRRQWRRRIGVTRTRTRAGGNGGRPVRDGAHGCDVHHIHVQLQQEKLH